MPRFYLPDLHQPVLVGPEAHHCAHVLRLGPGDELELFDGHGQALRARIETITKREVRLSPLEPRATPPLPVAVTLAVAIIKKNFEFILQKATELGVTAIVPLVTDRTIVRGGKPERWQEVLLEACKQCGNNWLPRLATPQSVAEFLASQPPAGLKLVAALQPEARSLKTILTAAPLPLTAPRAVTLAIGPEGDFTPAEYQKWQQAGFTALTLGPLVLRADTAALYALSILHHELIVP